MASNEQSQKVGELIRLVTQQFGTFSEEQLRLMNHRIIDELNSRRQAVKFTFRKGDRVSFTVTRGRYSGITFMGTVMKLMPKNIKVQADGGMVWTVSPNLLTKQEEETA